MLTFLGCFFLHEINHLATWKQTFEKKITAIQQLPWGKRDQWLSLSFLSWFCVAPGV